MASRRACACLLIVAVFLLRFWVHTEPRPLPGMSGLFDANGLDDVLQAIRIDYTPAGELRYVPASVPARPTGRVHATQWLLPRPAFLAIAHSAMRTVASSSRRITPGSMSSMQRPAVSRARARTAWWS